MTQISDCCAATASAHGRRNWLKASAGTVVALAGFGLRSNDAQAAALNKVQRDAMTPDGVIAMMEKGNLRFRAGKMHPHDYVAQKRASAAGQYPAAVILSCIDSRAPAEIIMDMGIGETFNARIAGNVSNKDVLGSMEFACAVSGAKVVLVMGHTGCGAIKGAIDKVELGNLTGLLDTIKPAVAATQYNDERTSKNPKFVDLVARTNVLLTMDAIREGSPILADLEKKGTIKIAGAMYDLSNGVVDFLN